MAVMVTLAMVVLVVEPRLAISCRQVDSALSPYISYLINGGNPTQAYCTSMKSLEKMIQTPKDR
ncbi:hypothetical protein L1049_025000 [Liquidambar formosana]|uniref:Uncharacterized protein n=1 Tax=Liquidambar formosana TaxID=63359 RepID=A0AAP0S2D3_LIQFO